MDGRARNSDAGAQHRESKYSLKRAGISRAITAWVKKALARAREILPPNISVSLHFSVYSILAVKKSVAAEIGELTGSPSRIAALQPEPFSAAATTRGPEAVEPAAILGHARRRLLSRVYGTVHARS